MSNFEDTVDLQKKASSNNITVDKILQATKDFKDAVLAEEDNPPVIGYTFNRTAWMAIRAKFNLDEDTVVSKFKGLPACCLEKQQEDCIGWFNKDMMNIYIEADASSYIDELPSLKSKEST